MIRRQRKTLYPSSHRFSFDKREELNELNEQIKLLEQQIASLKESKFQKEKNHNSWAYKLSLKVSSSEDKLSGQIKSLASMIQQYGDVLANFNQKKAELQAICGLPISAANIQRKLGFNDEDKKNDSNQKNSKEESIHRSGQYSPVMKEWMKSVLKDKVYPEPISPRSVYSPEEDDDDGYEPYGPEEPKELEISKFKLG